MTNTDTLLPSPVGTIPRKEVYDFILAAESGQPFQAAVFMAYLEEIVKTGLISNLPTWGHRVQALRYPDDTPPVVYPTPAPN